MQTALNHMTAPGLSFESFLDLAARLGCTGIELRNDIARPLFDGRTPQDAGRLVTEKGLRFLGLSQVYPFNDWTEERRAEVQTLIATATAAGAETISLIPRNDGTGLGNGLRQANLRIALKSVLPLLQESGMIGLVEPLGFRRSSLRSKTELAETIASIGGSDQFRIVHDTFHHKLAGEGPLFPAQTGIVHISGVADPRPAFDEMEDAHRGLVDPRDRLGNVEQIAALLAAGYDGVFSFECFAPDTHALADPYTEIRRSFEYISSQVQALAA